MPLPPCWLRSCRGVQVAGQQHSCLMPLLMFQLPGAAGLAAAGVPNDPAPTDFVPLSKCERCAFRAWDREEKAPRLHASAHGSAHQQLLAILAVAEQPAVVACRHGLQRWALQPRAARKQLLSSPPSACLPCRPPDDGSVWRQGCGCGNRRRAAGRSGLVGQLGVIRLFCFSRLVA